MFHNPDGHWPPETDPPKSYTTGCEVTDFQMRSGSTAFSLEGSVFILHLMECIKEKVRIWEYFSFFHFKKCPAKHHQ